MSWGCICNLLSRLGPVYDHKKVWLPTYMSWCPTTDYIRVKFPGWLQVLPAFQYTSRTKQFSNLCANFLDLHRLAEWTVQYFWFEILSGIVFCCIAKQIWKTIPVCYTIKLTQKNSHTEHCLNFQKCANINTYTTTLYCVKVRVNHKTVLVIFVLFFSFKENTNFNTFKSKVVTQMFYPYFLVQYLQNVVHVQIVLNFHIEKF